MDKLEKLTLPEPTQWPRLSIIIPACNEEDIILPAIQSLLANDYPDFEIILINDRSTDSTPELIDQLHRQDQRVVPVHIDHLPKGWLGKTNALNKGVQMASGKWLLFTDASILFKQNALKKTIALSEFEQLDHLVLMPDLLVNPSIATKFLLESLYSTNLLLTLQTIGLNIDKKNGKGFGLGCFNLVRKKALENSEGFEWLRMEILDDLGLGFLMKNSHAKTKIILGLEDVSHHWYSSFKELLRGIEKNSFTIFHYQLWRFITINSIFVLLLLGPLFMLFLPYTIVYAWPALIYIGVSLIALKINYVFKRSWWAAFFAPLGFLLLMFSMWRATILFYLRGGAYWRTTFYSAKELRKNLRVKM